MIRYRPTYSGDPAVLRELLQISVVLENLQGKMQIIHEAPVKPREGQVAICDGTNWNPLGDGIKRPVWFDGTQWNSF